MKPFFALGGGALIIAAMAGLSGCGSTDDRASVVKVPPAYRPEGFPDIALERLRGYRLVPGEIPLAVAYANGALRRFHVAFQTKDGDEPEDAIKLRDRLASGLTDQGWTRSSKAGAPVNQPETWNKGTEQLTITTQPNRSALVVTIDLVTNRTP